MTANMGADIVAYLKGLRCHLDGMNDSDSCRTKEILDQVIPALSALKGLAVEIDENLVLTDSYLGEMARLALGLVGGRIIERKDKQTDTVPTEDLQELEKRLRIRSTDFERRSNMEEDEASRQWQLGRSEALDDVADEIAAMIERSAQGG